MEPAGHFDRLLTMRCVEYPAVEARKRDAIVVVQILGRSRQPMRHKNRAATRKQPNGQMPACVQSMLNL